MISPGTRAASMFIDGLVSVDITLYNILYIQVLGLVSMSNDGLVSVDNSI